MWRLEIKLLFVLLFARFHFQPKLGVLRGEKQVQREHANRCRLTRLFSSFPGYITGKSSSRIPGCWRFCCDTSFKSGSVLELRSHFKALSGNPPGSPPCNSISHLQPPLKRLGTAGQLRARDAGTTRTNLGCSSLQLLLFCLPASRWQQASHGHRCPGMAPRAQPRFRCLRLCPAPRGVGKPRLAGKLCWWAAPDERCFRKGTGLAPSFRKSVQRTNLALV